MIQPTPWVEILHLQEKSYNFNLTDQTEPEIPKSVELVNTVPPKTNCEDDFLHPTVAANKNLARNFYLEDSDIPFMEEVHSNNTNKNKSKDINWDDMLDSELLVTMTANDKENKRSNENKISEISFPDENITGSENIANENNNNTTKGEKRKIKKIAEPKTKRKRSDGNTGVKLQKINQPVKQPNKNIFSRKQKYTKAVKNWLNNVEPHHPIDEDLGNIVSASNVGLNITKEIDLNAPSKDTPITNEINVINKTLKTTKKVVQAQLANKDGIMKFRKPKQIFDETKKSADVLETKPKEAQEKKMKKFIAPIKSQIPVKDVTFVIRTIDEDNIENNQNIFHHTENNEIFAVLTYW